MAVLELIIPVRPKRSHAVLEPACPNCGHGILGSGPQMPCPECGGDVRDAFRRPELGYHALATLVRMRRTIAIGIAMAACIVIAPWAASAAGAERVGLLAAAWVPGACFAAAIFHLASIATTPPEHGPDDPELATCARPVRIAAACGCDSEPRSGSRRTGFIP